MGRGGGDGKGWRGWKGSGGDGKRWRGWEEVGGWEGSGGDGRRWGGWEGGKKGKRTKLLNLCFSYLHKS